jgi:hypothetical protein
MAGMFPAWLQAALAAEPQIFRLGSDTGRSRGLGSGGNKLNLTFPLGRHSNRLAWLVRLRCRRVLKAVGEAGHLTEAGEALGLVHGQVEEDGDQEHEADHGAGPEALHGPFRDPDPTAAFESTAEMRHCDADRRSRSAAGIRRVPVRHLQRVGLLVDAS